MNTIYKYSFEAVPGGIMEAVIPHGAKVLKIDIQRGRIQLWALIETEVKLLVKRRYFICGTGHRLPDEVWTWQHVATLQAENGLVVHLFALPDSEFSVGAMN